MLVKRYLNGIVNCTVFVGVCLASANEAETLAIFLLGKFIIFVWKLICTSLFTNLQTIVSHCDNYHLFLILLYISVICRLSSLTIYLNIPVDNK